MGNIIKINLYVDNKRKNRKKFKLETIENNILNYKSWLKDTNKEDKVENYEEFLQAK